MTVSHKAGDILDGGNFDKLIAGKFPPMRRRSDITDFVPTIAVEHTTAEDRASCSACKGQCNTYEACGLPKPDPKMVRRVWGGYAVFLIVVSALLYWRFA